jgi:8-oxo-dGTP pyrophosphatase MutT (NUDIX family)
MRLLPVPVRRAGFRVAHALLRVYWVIARPHSQGVKCVVREGDDVIFVRHTYGDRGAWELPGGGVRRNEAPREAAAREIREELGVDLADWRLLGDIRVRRHGKHTTISCFEGRAAGRSIVVDEGELREVRWCSVDRAPEPLGKDARMILDELLGATDGRSS